jgi:hypothetical protein
MSRTDHILAAITAAVEKRRRAFDSDECVQTFSITIKFSEAGQVRLVEFERRERDDLLAHPRRPGFDARKARVL